MCSTGYSPDSGHPSACHGPQSRQRRDPSEQPVQRGSQGADGGRASRSDAASAAPLHTALALTIPLSTQTAGEPHFPTDEAVFKLLFLVLNLAAKEWRMPAREWAAAKAQFAILFEDRSTAT